MLPLRNEADLDELPEDVRNDLEIVFLSRINEVIDNGLEVLVANPPPPRLPATESSTQSEQPLAARKVLEQ